MTNFTFKTQPWAHQVKALEFAAERKAVMLALDMGTGKSKVLIDLVENLLLFPALILCPKAVVSVWPTEFARHGHTPHTILALDRFDGKKKARLVKEAFALEVVKKKGLVVVINYEAARMEPLRSELLSHQWGVIALDESHKIKAPGGKTSWLCKALAAKATRRLCLTGTPLPHSPMDAYAQYRFLDPAIFGHSYTRFRAMYAVMGGFHNKQIVQYRNLGDFETRMKSIMIRVKSQDVQDLPEQIDVTKFCYLSPEAQAITNRLKKDFIVAVEAGIVTASNALVRLLRMQQITSGYLKTDDTDKAQGREVHIDQAKANLLLDILSDLASDEPVVVFCKFWHDLDTVHRIGDELSRTTGELSGRENALRAFQDGTSSLLAVQMQSGGVGIDLTRARYCIYYSLGFSLGDYEQSRKRVHRPGQNRAVTYIHLLAKDSIDERVIAALKAKQNVINSILEGGL